MKTRRDFIKASSLASASLFVPQLLSAFELPEYRINKTDKNLIIIQLTGGCDGLNVVVPYRNDIYYRSRPKIAIRHQSVTKLNSDLGFHPAMKEMQRLYDDGYLSIINNVGYPDPIRSHFRSMDIWHSASGSKQVVTTGWLGRYLDQMGSKAKDWDVLNLDQTLHLAVRGNQKSGFAVGGIENMKAEVASQQIKRLAASHNHEDELVSYLYRTLTSTVSATEYISNQLDLFSSRSTYPAGQFGKSLKQTAELICSGTESKVYYLSLGSFDTHFSQVKKQERLLVDLSQGVSTFVTELKKQKRFDDSLILIFSEFGRRVAENGSEGTDHGTANNLYIIGKNLKRPGIFNEAPDLTNLDEGDLKFTVDFRNVYSAVLDNWLQVDSSKILGEKFNPISII